MELSRGIVNKLCILFRGNFECWLLAQVAQIRVCHAEVVVEHEKKGS